MALESLTGTVYIDALTSTNPVSSDPKSEGDDHIRGIKNVLKTTFPNVSGAVTATHTELNYTDITAPGTVEASKAVVVDANKDISGFRKIVGTSSSGYTVSMTTTGLTATDAAVVGITSGATGNGNVGVYGISDGATSKSVSGVANHTTGGNFGVYGSSASTAGYGGYFTSPYNAVYGRGTGTSAVAVNAYADSATGTTYGVYSRNDSVTGYAGYFVTTASGGVPIFASALDEANSRQVAALSKGGRQLRFNPRTSAAAENPIQQAGDQAICSYGAAGAIDTGVLTLAPYATDAVGIRIDSTADTVVIHGSTTAATFASTTATLTTANVTTANITGAYTATGTGAYYLQPVETTGVITTSSTLNKKAEYLCTAGGTIYVQFTILTTNGSYTASARIYVNGSAVGTLRTTTSTSAVTFGELITIAPGNLLQIYAANSHNAATWTELDNIAFLVDETSKAAPPLLRSKTY